MASSVDEKLLRKTKFPPELSEKVDREKINVDVIKNWIAERLTQILGAEDDVVTLLCFSLFDDRFPQIKPMQIQLTGFLEKDAPAFCKELWTLCLSAQSSETGIPKELVEAKKRALMQEQEKIEAFKASRFTKAAARTRQSIEDRDRDQEQIGPSDRAGQRGKGERSDRAELGRRGRRGHRGRDDDRRGHRDSRSPPRRYSRDRDDYRHRLRADTYVPSRRGRRDDRSRDRSTSSRRRVSSSSARSTSKDRFYRPRGHWSRSRSEGSSSRGSMGRHETRSRSPPYRGIPRSRIARSRSRSPRNYRSRRDRSVSSSLSRSPPRRRAETRRRSPSPSSSISGSPGNQRDRRGSPSKDKRSLSFSSVDENLSDTSNRADARKEPTSSDRPHGTVPVRKRQASPEADKSRVKRRRSSSPVASASESGGDGGTKPTVNELRERLLKEKIIAQHRASQSEES